jgi:hypothetical protein
MSKQQFCVNTVVAKLLNGYVRQPDYSDLIETIHANAFCEFKRYNPDNIHVGHRLVKILCCTPTHVVFEENPEERQGWYRRNAKVITLELGQWERYFSRWVERVDGATMFVGGLPDEVWTEDDFAEFMSYGGG